MTQGSMTTLTGRRVLLSPFSPIVLGALCCLSVAAMFLTSSSSLVLCYDIEPTSKLTGETTTAVASEDENGPKREDAPADAPLEAIQKAMEEIDPIWLQHGEGITEQQELALDKLNEEEQRAERLRKELALTDLVKKLNDAREQRNKKIIAGTVAGVLGAATLVALLLFARSRYQRNKDAKDAVQQRNVENPGHIPSGVDAGHLHFGHSGAASQYQQRPVNGHAASGDTTDV